MKKVISLDFWGTLVTYNPLYSAARTRYFSDISGLPEEIVKQRYKALKRRINETSANFGTATTPILALGYLIEQLPEATRSLSAAEMARDLAQMFRENPPILLPEMRACLQRASAGGHLICLSSNTDFIGGETIQELFDHLPIAVWTFSDMLGVAKPHREFFKTVLLRARDFRSDLFATDFVHVGDNQTCDIAGAERAGMQAHFVNNPQETIEFVSSVSHLDLAA